ncbi:hypothetical protein LOZ12_005278 [Ophidiomyces ophidiicola]|uniref:Uncharacterized protein n=1 Tax=Ophidiomyces ophidiicola TaxID=1387563 RepID=A0ACB8UPX9_9EURO|nr:uncharacterized protein LOZ57_004117 [Ophidiomyces ophidiicola]KAI1945431.1 hypothetical protein LOZ57_004117 [Ophidiomyces ophidiicola]KAI1949663.1 hypothetical protein LOZ62_002215 [Ophidiomyces ophidiicola]KAI1967978.1 hypothetical protein LOZ56_005256 [Ophidiomyces ophidiicola]KAI2009686.1 hypothetical protein LOZ50_001420 [Ophidiomyces ophidiicola]KAI2023058.1 hypothetical protein LOZ45_004141 [Ophidiomyces ophidiicola]
MALPRALRHLNARYASTATQTTKAAGDISSVFPSLRPDYKPEPLPDRFKSLKAQIFQRNADALTRSWPRLLSSIKTEVDEVTVQGNKVIPSVDFQDLSSGNVTTQTLADIQRRGAVVIRNVLSRSFALDLKQRARDYIAENEGKVKAFPADKPTVYELYWSPSQVEARAHPNMLATQRFLHSLWHSSDPSTPVSFKYPVSYADRLRIREPGDSKFSLGPHADGGSLERWEDPEYSKVYSEILRGSWEEYDPFDAKHRIKANMNLYNGAGACSMLRFFQGWLAMSDTGPGEGTLRVCPMIKQSTAYTILRPFFDTNTSSPVNDSTFPGAVPGASQEYSEESHPHLDLSTTMVPMPTVQPGDYVAWHCDAIHSVDKEHRGKGDSSVLYIPAAPLCEMNAEYLKKQREAALAYSPPWDFPDAGGPGEHGFRGTVDWSSLNAAGLQAMGMGSTPWKIESGMTQGEVEAVKMANKICFGK